MNDSDPRIDALAAVLLVYAKPRTEQKNHRPTASWMLGTLVPRILTLLEHQHGPVPYNASMSLEALIEAVRTNYPRLQLRLETGACGPLLALILPTPETNVGQPGVWSLLPAEPPTGDPHA
jgi:hypothetical protein